MHIYTSPRRPLDLSYVKDNEIDWSGTDIGAWTPETRFAFKRPLDPFMISQWGLIEVFDRSWETDQQCLNAHDAAQVIASYIAEMSAPRARHCIEYVAETNPHPEVKAAFAEWLQLQPA